MDPSNRPTIGRHVGPQERAQGVAPLGRLAEQLVEALLLLLGCSGVAAARCGSGSAGPGRARARRRPPSARVRNMIVGTAACGSARAPTTSKCRSVIAPAPATVGEELVELSVGLAAAVEAAPQPAQVPDQLVAGVDRHDEALGTVTGRSAHRRTRKASTSGCMVGQLRVGRDHLVPRVERAAPTRWRPPDPGRRRPPARAPS